MPIAYIGATRQERQIMTTTAEARPAVGAVLTDVDVDALPVESVVIYTSSGTEWTRQPEDIWQSKMGARSSTETMKNRARSGNLTLSSIPDDVPTGLTGVDTTVETTALDSPDTMPLAAFKQLFGTVAWGSQQAHGVSSSTVKNALDQLGIPEFEVGEGAYVSVGDNQLIAKLPVNTLLTTRTEPTDRSHIVFRVDGSRRLQFLMGDIHYDTYTVLKVVAHPEGLKASWIGSESEPEAAAEALLKFKKKAWKITRDVKASTGWCGVLEDTVKRAGVTSEVERIEIPSKALTAEDVAALPVGTILRYGVLGSNSSVLYVRDDAADNPAKTRKIGGVLDGSWVKKGAVVVAQPEDTMNIQVYSRDEMGSMPLGTVVTDNGRNSWRRTQVTDGGREARNWRLTTQEYDHNYCPNDFSIGTLTYTVIPGIDA